MTLYLFLQVKFSVIQLSSNIFIIKNTSVYLFIFTECSSLTLPNAYMYIPIQVETKKASSYI